MRKPEVIARPLPDRTVLLNGTTGGCFELNAVGSTIWNQLDGSRSLPEISDAIAAEFRLSPEQATSDVEIFAEALSAASLIEAVGLSVE